jgi:hypothetical protein
MSTLATFEMATVVAPSVERPAVRHARLSTAPVVDTPLAGEPINYEAHMMAARRLRAEAMSEGLGRLVGWLRRR